MLAWTISRFVFTLARSVRAARTSDISSQMPSVRKSLTPNSALHGLWTTTQAGPTTRTNSGTHAPCLGQSDVDEDQGEEA